jgi:hypothetical protein
MLEPRSSPSGFKWRRTAFARIDGAIDIAEDDWSLVIDGMSAARIYRVRGGPHNGRWFWAVQIGPGRVQLNSGAGHAAGGREAREVVVRLNKATRDRSMTHRLVMPYCSHGKRFLAVHDASPTQGLRRMDGHSCMAGRVGRAGKWISFYIGCGKLDGGWIAGMA